MTIVSLMRKIDVRRTVSGQRCGAMFIREEAAGRSRKPISITRISTNNA